MSATTPAQHPKNNPAKRSSKGGVIQASLLGIEPLANCSDKPKRAPKIWRVLQAFKNGERWHRFTAFELHDTCLHTTVSTLRHNYGVKFDDREITVKTKGGFVTHVTEYWLDASNDNRCLVSKLLSTRGLA